MNQHQGKRSKKLAKHYERQFDLTTKNKARRAARIKRRAALWKSRGATGTNAVHAANKAIKREVRRKTKALRTAKEQAEALAGAQ